ncbi:MAG: adenylate/guanylate cyclase domain-containing protein [Balneolaceae bacterium]|nr:MAG: adenylate/guanylate cyclase domain-containing protein [Balneolaceae bacterium]
MFADIVGYSKMMQQDELNAKSTRDHQRSVIETYLLKYHGKVLQYYGDGTLIMFGSALAAVQCARDIQDELAKKPTVPLRIGIHIGDIVYDDEGIYGDAVNIASRVQSFGAAGSVIISENVFTEIKNHPGFRVESFGEQKLKNISKPLKLYSLVCKSHELPEQGDIEESEQPTEDETVKEDQPSKKQLGSLNRGVSDMFRTSYRNHINLSAIADTKSNIMISINGIIISIIIASISTRILSNSLLIIPTAILLITCMMSLVYSVLAARPRVSNEKVTLDDVRSNRSNILFFGNFYTMERDDFVTGIEELMTDSERLYDTMARDLHGLGTVLSKKFKLLRVAYNIFMVGLVASVCSFLLVYLLI